jgi:putative transposase
VAEVCAQTGWRVHAWVIMGNHYHLFIETPEANLVEGMKWLQNTYTRRFNVRHRAWGRVFGDRYKCVVVEGELPEYYGSLVDYIHLNPARAGIVSGRRGESLLDYRWSSLAEGYALPVGKRRSGWPPMWGWKDWDTAIRRRVGGRWWRTWTGAHWRRDAKAVWCRCPLK